jgi:uncharacterized protein YcbK (DUF882 family)
MSRKIEDLTPKTQELYWLFAEAMARARIPFMVTCTFRSQEDQDVLFQQGRTTPGKVVTWTRNSRHTKRTAFDIAILRDGKPTWDIKMSLNDNDIPDYQEAGTIGEMVGLTAGAFWKTPDFPHFQNDKEDI